MSFWWTPREVLVTEAKALDQNGNLVISCWKMSMMVVHLRATQLSILALLFFSFLSSSLCLLA